MARIRNSGAKVRVVVFVRFLRAQHTFPFETGVLSFRAERSVVEKSLDLSVLQHISTKILPPWIQLINQAEFLRAGPFLQLRFSSDRVTDITIMFVIDQLSALILCGEPDLGSFAMLPGSARESVCHADVKNDFDS
jgi:hypothetical protein